MSVPRRARAVQVTVTAPIQPTEVEERVVEAATRFLPGGRAEVVANEATVTGDDLSALRQRVWELRIIDTFRGALLAGMTGDVVRFRLSKQAAYAGRVSLPPAPHALGDLSWDVRVDATDPWDAEGLVWWLCPETKEGEVVGPV